MNRMQKRVLMSAVGLVMGFAPMLQAQMYYFSTDGSDAASGDINNPKQTLAEAKSLIGPGVTIRFRRGDVWYGDSWNLSGASGAAGAPCVFADWGDPADPEPVISNSVRIPGNDGNWTNQGSNNWSHSLGGVNVDEHIGVFVDGVRKLDDGSVGQTVNFDEYEEDGNTLTVYFDDNSPTGHLVEVTPANTGPVLTLTGASFLTFRNIVIRGGTGATVSADAPTENLTFEGVVIRQCSKRGAAFLGAGTAKHVNPRFINCVINRDWGLYMNVPPVLDATDATGGDGLQFLSAVEGGLVRGVHIIDFGHTGLTFRAVDGDLGVYNVVVEECDISAPKSNYCRAFAFSSKAGLMTNVVFRRNRLHDLSQQSKFGGENGQYYANVFYRCYAGNPPGTKVTSRGVTGAIFRANPVADSTPWVSRSNLVFNNTFFDIEWNALYSIGSSNPDSNIIKNNLFIKMGQAPTGGVAIQGNQYFGDNNSFINNGTWKTASNDVVFIIAGTVYTAGAFNDALASASGNMQAAPLIVDDHLEHPDLHLQPDSPYVRAGAPLPEISGMTDFDGNPFLPDSPSVGAFQFPGDWDNDGMPETWEIYHFGGTNLANGGPDQDWDGDGVTNLKEYLADTVPTDPNDSFRIKGSPSSQIEWTGSDSRLYTLYTTTNLPAGLWNITGVTNAPGTNGIMCFDVPADGVLRYFMVEARFP